MTVFAGLSKLLRAFAKPKLAKASARALPRISDSASTATKIRRAQPPMPQLSKLQMARDARTRTPPTFAMRSPTLTRRNMLASTGGAVALGAAYTLGQRGANPQSTSQIQRSAYTAEIQNRINAERAAYERVYRGRTNAIEPASNWYESDPNITFIDYEGNSLSGADAAFLSIDHGSNDGGIISFSEGVSRADQLATLRKYRELGLI